ncbi:MAG: DUF368 domain-containing protein [Candidatus Izemoplasmatales bacterium]|jgi:putative membrane protein|nr:DUF368 domain-containing protein [Candidatus Izemoplasmatales bacterium]MDD3865343.1 DUF368 domain-containing protein [Candidatus Izemoplasmatales bacterium]
MFLDLLLRGFIVGLSFTIPGCSGGTFAVYVGIYDRLLHALGNIFTDFKNSMKFLIPVGIGLVAGILLFSSLMALALQVNSFVTIMVFIGLTIGGVPNLLKHVKGHRVTTSGIMAFIIAFLIVIALVVFQVMNGTNGTDFFTIDFSTILLLFGLGVIGAISMIIPGVSGSGLLMIMGFYTAIVSNVVGNLLDFTQLGYNLSVLLPFGIGAVVGVVFISKLLESILKKYPVQSYLAIIGFIIASAVTLFIWMRDSGSASDYTAQTPIYQFFWQYVSTNIVTVVFGIVGLGLGLLGSTLIVKFGAKQSQGKSQNC